MRIVPITRPPCSPITGTSIPEGSTCPSTPVLPDRTTDLEQRPAHFNPGTMTERSQAPRGKVTKIMVASPPPLGQETLDSALDALLADYPTAFVAAINADGVFVPMPASVSLASHQVLNAHSMLDLVVSEDRERLISTWERARDAGASSTQVRLELDHGRLVVIHYLDARARHGVYVGVVVGGEAAALKSLPDIGPRPPRIARVHKNEIAVFLEVDEAITRILGWNAAEMVGLHSLDFIHQDDQGRAIESWMQMLSEPGTIPPPARLRHRRSDGSWAWFEVTNHNHLADPDRGYVLAQMIDISDEMAAQEALRERIRLFTAQRSSRLPSTLSANPSACWRHWAPP